MLILDSFFALICLAARFGLFYEKVLVDSRGIDGWRWDGPGVGSETGQISTSSYWLGLL